MAAPAVSVVRFFNRDYIVDAAAVGWEEARERYAKMLSDYDEESMDSMRQTKTHAGDAVNAVLAANGKTLGRACIEERVRTLPRASSWSFNKAATDALDAHGCVTKEDGGWRAKHAWDAANVSTAYTRAPLGVHWRSVTGGHPAFSDNDGAFAFAFSKKGNTWGDATRIAGGWVSLCSPESYDVLRMCAAAANNVRKKRIVDADGTKAQNSKKRKGFVCKN